MYICYVYMDKPSNSYLLLLLLLVVVVVVVVVVIAYVSTLPCWLPMIHWVRYCSWRSLGVQSKPLAWYHVFSVAIIEPIYLSIKIYICKYLHMYIYNYIWWSGCFSLALSLAELFEKAMEGGREREREMYR